MLSCLRRPWDQTKDFTQVWTLFTAQTLFTDQTKILLECDYCLLIKPRNLLEYEDRLQSKPKMTTTNIIISTSMQKQKTTSTNNNQQGLEETFTSTKDDVEISLAILNTWSSFHQVDRPSSSNWLCLHRHRHHHCLYHHHHRLYSYTIILTVTNLLTRIDLTILRYGTTQTQAKPSMVLDRDMEASTLLGPAYLSVSKDQGGGP